MHGAGGDLQSKFKQKLSYPADLEDGCWSYDYFGAYNDDEVLLDLERVRCMPCKFVKDQLQRINICVRNNQHRNCTEAL
jgi:hypothetical protein